MISRFVGYRGQHYKGLGKTVSSLQFCPTRTQSRHQGQQRTFSVPCSTLKPAVNLGKLMRRKKGIKKSHHFSNISASLWTLPDELVSALHLTTSIAITIGIGLSTLPLLTGDSKERNERRFFSPNAEEGADNIKWGVMSVLSFLPFLNPMGWVFGALDDEASSRLYWSFAWVYTMPYVTSGFEFDTFSILSLLLGICHMQIERIAQTEPVEIELSEVTRNFIRSIPGVLSSLARYGAGVGGELSGRVKKSAEAQKRKPDRKYLEQKSREARMELDDFDRRRRERERGRKEERE